MHIADLRPLPSSLDPLADESLPGFIMRLAHRLERSPARLLEITGLATAGRSRFACRAGYELMVRLAPDVRDRFAEAVRLTPAEADALCLDHPDQRFPLPEMDRHDRIRQQRTSWWLFSSATRFCPKCLHGDGTAIQQAHGGPWRRSWRFPITFACVEHRCFLNHQCPSCGRDALHGPGGTGRTPFLPQSQLVGLHPAQCRMLVPAPNEERAACAARLDAADGRPAPPPRTLKLQSRLSELMAPTGPAAVASAGKETTPPRYFTDLRLLSHLILTTWPQARGRIPHPALAEAVDHYTKDHEARPIPTRPLDSMVMAAVLTAADTALASATVADCRDRLQELLPGGRFAASRTGWGYTFLGTDPATYSDGLRQAALPLVHAFTRAGYRARRAPEPQLGFQAQHVPQRLPDELVERHLQPIAASTGSGLFHLRRAAGARLVQMAAGGSFGDAACYLGYPTGTVEGRRIMHGPTRRAMACVPDAFDRAVRAMAEDLAAGPLIDYWQRRLALERFELNPHSWETIYIPVLAAVPRRFRTSWKPTEANRQLASMIVWYHVTHGELRLSPRPILERQPPETRELWTNHRVISDKWPLLIAHSPSRLYTGLREQIETYTRIADRQPVATITTKCQLARSVATALSLGPEEGHRQ